MHETTLRPLRYGAVTRVFRACFAGYPAGVTTASAYPGVRLGLPEHGRGSMATFPRRLVAIFIDWMACSFIVHAALGVPWGGLTGPASFLPLGLFALENVLLVAPWEARWVTGSSGCRCTASMPSRHNSRVCRGSGRP